MVTQAALTQNDRRLSENLEIERKHAKHPIHVSQCHPMLASTLNQAMRNMFKDIWQIDPE